MKQIILHTLAYLSLAITIYTPFASHAMTMAEPAAIVGQTAPDFTATDTHGAAIKLSDFKGKTVVLEWTNHECPFVKKHYESGNMQALQKEATEKGVIWLSIVSSAPEKQGHTTAEDANKIVKESGASPTAKILDESGSIGKLYGAKTTPHMFIVNKEGVLAYAGAIDDNTSPDPAATKTAKNYVRGALNELAAEKPVTTASTNPYGCGVKY